MLRKIFFSLMVLALSGSGIVACWGMRFATHEILYVSKTIDNKFPATAYVEIEPEYIVEQYLKDLYVWFDLFFDAAAILLVIGVASLIIYLLLLKKFYSSKAIAK